MKLTLRKSSFLIAFSVVVLSACSDNNNTTPALVAGTDVPVTATETTAGVVSFANLSAGTSDDAAEPILVGEAALASSETDEPDPSV